MLSNVTIKINLMKYLVQIILIVFGLSASAQKQFVVDAEAELREITGSFTSIKISSGIHLYLSNGDTEAIAVSASDEKNKAEIKTEVENGELHVFYNAEKMWKLNDKKLNVYVSFKKLEHITASGASNVYIVGVLESPSLDIKLSGASDFKGQLKIEDFNIKISGASDMKLTGTAKNLNLECSGASDFKSYDFITETCSIKASGASDVYLTVSKEINANASGASNILYKGSAQIKEKHSSGASSISNMD